MGVLVRLASGEEVLQAENGQSLKELHCKVGRRPASSVPTFLRADGRMMTSEEVVEDEPLTLVWVEWWHNFHIRQQSPSLFQCYFPHESFNVGLLEMALLTELQGGNIDYERALQADIEIAILNVLHHFRPESPFLKHVRDFMAFAVAYLPSELSSVLGVLLDAAMRDMSGLKELRRFGFGENFTATLSLVEETVKHLLRSLDSESKDDGGNVLVVFKSEPPKTINVPRKWKQEAYVYFRKLQPKLLKFLQLRDQLAFAGRAHEIDGWLNLHRPHSHEPNHYDTDPRFNGLWAL